MSAICWDVLEAKHAILTCLPHCPSVLPGWRATSEGGFHMLALARSSFEPRISGIRPFLPGEVVDLVVGQLLVLLPFGFPLRRHLLRCLGLTACSRRGPGHGYRVKSPGSCPRKLQTRTQNLQTWEIQQVQEVRKEEVLDVKKEEQRVHRTDTHVQNRQYDRLLLDLDDYYSRQPWLVTMKDAPYIPHRIGRQANQRKDLKASDLSADIVAAEPIHHSQHKSWQSCCRNRSPLRASQGSSRQGAVAHSDRPCPEHVLQAKYGCHQCSGGSQRMKWLGECVRFQT